jgi:hypothetical protein
MDTKYKEAPFSKISKDRLAPTELFLQESLKDPDVKKAFDEQGASI